MRRLAEGAAELTAEVGWGQTSHTGQVGHGQRVRVSRIGEVLRAQEVSTGGKLDAHAPSIAQRACSPSVDPAPVARSVRGALRS